MASQQDKGETTNCRLKTWPARIRQLIRPNIGRRYDTTGLCTTCRSILRRSLRKTQRFQPCPFTDYNLKVHPFKVRPVSELLASTCRLCQALPGLMPVEESEADKGPWSLVCTSSAHVFEPGSALPYPTLHFVPTRYLQWGYHHLNIHSWGYLAINAAGRRGDTYPRTILPSAIDVEYLKGIVQNCVASHEGCQASQKKQAEGLRVIDCETQEVVEAPPDCQYFALSYVWGAPAASGDAKGRSKVVQDSITVTREFGCKYLWVDKHVSQH